MQPELPLGIPAPVVRYRKPVAPDPRVHYAPWRPATHTLCHDCITDIHTRGIAVAPPPNTVRWRRTHEDAPTLELCQQHKTNREAAGA